MSRIQDYFRALEVDGEVIWPESQDARDKLASDLLGAEITSALDSWMDRAVELLENPAPTTEHRRKNVTWERDMKLRAALATLTPEQRSAVKQLVAETSTGTLFSALVAFDQCAGIDIRIDAHDMETEEKIASVLPGYLDFHDRLYEWIAEFSEDPGRFDPNAPGG